MRQRAIAWDKEDPAGVEFTEVTLAADAMFASGVAVGGEPSAYRLDYTLATGPRFVTTRLQVTTRGQGWRRTLDLRRDGSGAWTAATTSEGDSPEGLAPPGVTAGGAGERIGWLDGALDCDLGLSPLTNSMPALRHRLLEVDGSVELLMAWVSVPDLGLHASRQRYTALRDRSGGGRLIRFESLDSGFTAELVFDQDGLVVDYPGIGRQLG
jgi:hypothetical protein